MRQFGDLALPLSVLLMLLLAAYLALYPAIFALVMHRLLRALRPRGRCWFAPAVWVTTELGRAHLFTGFPWVLLGYSQAHGAAGGPARQRVRRVRAVVPGRRS